MNEGAPIIIKKKKAHGHGHHGGAWKVAYADFVTAMMAFFLVMWIMGLSPEERESVESYFNDPMGYTRTAPKGRPNIGFAGTQRRSNARNNPTAADASSADRQDLESLHKAAAAVVAGDLSTSGLESFSKLIEVKLTDEGLEIEFVEGQGVAYFEVGSTVVTSRAKHIIGDLATVLAKSGRIMKVYGHTDARSYAGNGYDNFDLSADRANAVKRVLTAAGVRRSQIREVVGFADQRLKVPTNPLDPRNRRVTLVLPYVSQTAETKVSLANPAKTDLAKQKDQVRGPKAPGIRDLPVHNTVSGH